MNCLIIDGHKNTRNALKKFIAMDPALKLAGECTNTDEAHSEILAGQIDIIFLDFTMHGKNGIELAKNLEGNPPMIIFITSKSECYDETFDLNVIDFLPRPVNPLRFSQAIEKARELTKLKSLAIFHKEDDFLFIRDGNIVRRLKIDEILYLEASGDHVDIHLGNHIYIIHSTLKSAEQKLPQEVFLRTHRSFLVNISKIDTVEGRSLIINKHIVPVSDAYRAMVNERMQFL